MPLGSYNPGGSMHKDGRTKPLICLVGGDGLEPPTLSV